MCLEGSHHGLVQPLVLKSSYANILKHVLLNFFLTSILLRSANFKMSQGADLERTVDREAICGLINVILQSFLLTRDTLQCLDETALFSSSNGPFFRDFIVQKLQQRYGTLLIVWVLITEYYALYFR